MKSKDADSQSERGRKCLEGVWPSGWEWRKSLLGLGTQWKWGGQHMHEAPPPLIHSRWRQRPAQIQMSVPATSAAAPHKRWGSSNHVTTELIIPPGHHRSARLTGQVSAGCVLGPCSSEPWVLFLPANGGGGKLSHKFHFFSCVPL